MSGSPRSPTTSRIPLAPSASGGSCQLIFPADLQRIAEDIGLSLTCSDIDGLAADLEDAAQRYTMFSRVDVCATPGEAAAWCDGLLKHADGLLKALGADARGECDASHHALVILASGADDPDWLRDTMRERAFGYDADPDPFDDMRRFIDALRMFHRRAELTARRHSAMKGRSRRAAWPEITLFRRMATAFHTAFGRDYRVTVSTGAKVPAGAVSGPSIAFSTAVLALIRERYRPPDDADGPQRDAEWLQRLDTLLRSPHAIAGRIRDIRNGGSVRKR